METVTDFFGGRKTLQMVIEAMKLKDTCSLKEKGMTEDEMAGWHDQLNGQEFEQALGVGDTGMGSLACCSPWSHKESDMTEQLN